MRLPEPLPDQALPLRKGLMVHGLLGVLRPVPDPDQRQDGSFDGRHHHTAAVQLLGDVDAIVPVPKLLGGDRLVSVAALVVPGTPPATPQWVITARSRWWGWGMAYTPPKVTILPSMVWLISRMEGAGGPTLLA